MIVLPLASSGTVVSPPCTLGGEGVAADQLGERAEDSRAGADMVGQSRDVKVDALTGVGFALPVQGLMLAVFGVKDHR